LHTETGPGTYEAAIVYSRLPDAAIVQCCLKLLLKKLPIAMALWPHLWLRSMKIYQVAEGMFIKALGFIFQKEFVL
jgi:hypothetical protein